MIKKQHLAVAAILALTGCSEAGDSTQGSSEAVSAASDSTGIAQADAVLDHASAAAPIPSAMPKLAYAYGLSFALAADDVGKLMRRHANLCEQQGPQSCRIIGMDLTGDAEAGDANGSLQLAVAANHARAVSALLEDEASDMGADQTATTIGSEEVSKTIVDTEARIRSRVELRDRLTEVLRTRRGSVQELVEAERQVAAVNEEIDQARSWLAETTGRVAFSRMDIAYVSHPAMASRFLAPIAGAAGSLGAVLGFVFAALMLLATILLPIAGVVWIGRRINRRFAAPVEPA